MAEGWFTFLRYYGKLMAGVMLGRRKVTRPLGIMYRWRQWRYAEHLKRTQARAWQ